MPFQCLSEDIAAAPVPMDVTPTQRMMSACAGVLATSLVVTPMDVVKTRVQAAQAEYVSQQTASSLNAGRCGNEHCSQCAAPQGRTYTTSARATLAGFDSTATSTARLALKAAATAAPPPRYRVPALPTGTVAALMHIARWEGPRGLYRGLDASLVMAIPSTVLYYTVYDDFLARLEKAGAGNLAAPATAGSSARLLATVVMAPLELVRTRAQSHGGGGPAAPAGAQRAAAVATGPGRGAGWWGEIPLVGSVGRDLTKVFQEEGMAALWRGVGTTMWRDVPFSMVYWLGYENLKAGLGCGRKGGAPAAPAAGGGSRGTAGLAEERGSADFLLRSLVAGAVSGMVASLLTHPFDVVKTQRQVLVDVVPESGCEHRPPRPPRRAPGTFDVMRNIVESKGPAGLFTGALARVGKVAPACAIMMISYEAGKRFFGERNAAAAAAASSATAGTT
ncbi:unnamed protein product [Ectocarpus sp. CCAP 1310/34]|nr:unnamed protein product [Ectocarpus sp. CCAP 1310/34]